MKNILLITGAALVVIFLTSGYTNLNFSKDSEDGIQFYRGSWDEALEITSKENKVIFVDVYATWCGPCKLMKAHTFSDKGVGSFYNLNFINVTVDGEKGEGPDFVKKYGVKAYPSLFFIDSNGELVKGARGYQNPKQFISLGKKVLKNKNYETK